jgi:hypothetical protein
MLPIFKHTQNYFFYILLLLAVNSLSLDQKQGSYWWIEQQRFGREFSFTSVTCSIERKRSPLHHFWCRIPKMTRGVILWASCWLLFGLLVLCWRLFSYLVSEMEHWGIQTSDINCCWSQIVEGTFTESFVEMRISVQSSVITDLCKEPIVEDVPIFLIGNQQQRVNTPSSSYSYQENVPVPLADQMMTRRIHKDTVVSCKSVYSPHVAVWMKRFYHTLREKDKRRYAGIEALKLGHGGAAQIVRVLGCNRNTIYRGIKEIKALTQDSVYEKRTRSPGGGRKRYDLVNPKIHQQFLHILKDYTAGDPMEEKVIWTNLTYSQIIQHLEKTYHSKVSHDVIQQLLKKHNYHRRKIQKRKCFKYVKDRDAQFRNIKRLDKEYLKAGNPVISMDSKKKEYLGTLYREGKLYTQEQQYSYDHDFASYSNGVVLPHGIYDKKYNTGFINLGNSKDTGEFACDSLRNWWNFEGKNRYPNATSILIECDGGGSNSSRHYIFKKDLQELVDEIGIEIRIAHYPPYASKYNPIEHRLFPHVTRACQGVMFESTELVQELMSKTKTEKGLSVVVKTIDKEYKTKRKVSEEFKKNMRIQFDKRLSKWNYRAIPANA